MRAEYGLRSYYEYLEKEWEAHGSWEVMPERDRSSSLLRATPPFSCLHCRLPSRSARFITSSSSTSQEAHHEPATSYWIRRCNRQYIFLPQFTLVSRCRARDEKFFSLKLVRKLHLRSPRTQSLHCLSSGWRDDRERSFTMNALHSLENRARVLFAQTHNA